MALGGTAGNWQWVGWSQGLGGLAALLAIFAAVSYSWGCWGACDHSCPVVEKARIKWFLQEWARTKGWGWTSRGPLVVVNCQGRGGRGGGKAAVKWLRQMAGSEESMANGQCLNVPFQEGSTDCEENCTPIPYSTMSPEAPPGRIKAYPSTVAPTSQPYLSSRHPSCFFIFFSKATAIKRFQISILLPKWLIAAHLLGLLVNWEQEPQGAG